MSLGVGGRKLSKVLTVEVFLASLGQVSIKNRPKMNRKRSERKQMRKIAFGHKQSSGLRPLGSASAIFLHTYRFRVSVRAQVVNRFQIDMH